MALSWCNLESARERCNGRLAGGEGRLAAIDSFAAAAALDMVFRRPEAMAMGIAVAGSPSAMAAVIAATLAVWFVTDLRRVTRWFGFRAPVRREWEEFRAWDWRAGNDEEAAESEGRCCVNGLDGCCISFELRESKSAKKGSTFSQRHKQSSLSSGGLVGRMAIHTLEEAIAHELLDCLCGARRSTPKSSRRRPGTELQPKLVGEGRRRLG